MLLVEKNKTVDLLVGSNSFFPHGWCVGVLGGYLGDCGFVRWDLHTGLYAVTDLDGVEGVKYLLINSRRGRERNEVVSRFKVDAICRHLDRGETFFRAVYLTRGLC